MPKISITIATYFAEKYIKSCLDSILNQTFKDFEIIVIDNNSTDNTLSIIRKEYPLNNIKILENKENLGFAKAHNKGISTSSAEYILVTNQDIILEPDFLEKIVNFMDNNKSYASCGGKLLKMIYEDNKFKKTNTIDCIGLNHTKGYRFYNIGEGEIDNSQYDRDINLFGISGALVLYRKESLDKTKDQYGYFDERFFMYKEDIDLAWRLVNRGYKSFYLSEAIAYHERGFSGNNKQNIIQIANRKSNDKFLLSQLSYRNHWLMLKKNLRKKDLKFLPFIIFEEFIKLIYYLIFKPRVIFFRPKI